MNQSKHMNERLIETEMKISERENGDAYITKTVKVITPFQYKLLNIAVLVDVVWRGYGLSQILTGNIVGLTVWYFGRFLISAFKKSLHESKEKEKYFQTGDTTTQLETIPQLLAAIKFLYNPFSKKNNKTDMKNTE